MTLEYGVQRLAHRKNWHPVCQSSYTLEDFHWLLLLWAFTIGPMSADTHKQIGIWRGATSFSMRTVFLKQNRNFEKSQELKGRSEIFFKPVAFLN
jgi:hypothetical protein